MDNFGVLFNELVGNFGMLEPSRESLKSALDAYVDERIGLVKPRIPQCVMINAVEGGAGSSTFKDVKVSGNLAVSTEGNTFHGVSRPDAVGTPFETPRDAIGVDFPFLTMWNGTPDNPTGDPTKPQINPITFLSDLQQREMDRAEKTYDRLAQIARKNDPTKRHLIPLDCTIGGPVVGRCKDCKHGTPKNGSAEPLIECGCDKDYAHFCHFKPDFGCVHFEAKAGV